MNRPDSFPSSEPPVVVPVVQEQLHVGTQVEETGVLRVRVLTEEVQQPVALQRVRETVHVERVAVGTPVAQLREPWTEGDTLVVPVYEEVVERRLVLKEEIRLHRRRETASHTEPVPLRRQRAVVERRQADGSWLEVAPEGGA